MKTTTALTLLLACLGTTVAAQDELFPLHIGDSWTYVADLPNGDTLENTRTIDRASRQGAWLWLDSFHGVACWVDARRNRIYAFHDGQVTLLYDFRPRVAGWSINLSSACLTGRVQVGARDETVVTPAGTFTGCTRLDYQINCTDAGVRSEWLAPGVGVVQYTTSSIMGLVEHRLQRAIVDGKVIPEPIASDRGVTVALSLDSYRYVIDVSPIPGGGSHPPTVIEARFALQNRTDQDLALDFRTAQVFDIVLRNASGREVWRWSDGRLFAQFGSQQIVAAGKDLVIEEQILTRIGRTDIPPGDYTLEIALSSVQRFSGSAALRIIHAR